MDGDTPAPANRFLPFLLCISLICPGQRLDLATGQTQRWLAPEHTYCEEVVVVPKEGPSDAPAREDAVWVLASMFDAVRGWLSDWLARGVLAAVHHLISD